MADGAEKPSCDCTDVDARVGKDKHLKFVRRRCWDSFLVGECEKAFMFNTVKELPEGGWTTCMEISNWLVMCMAFWM